MGQKQKGDPRLRHNNRGPPVRMNTSQNISIKTKRPASDASNAGPFHTFVHPFAEHLNFVLSHYALQVNLLHHSLNAYPQFFIR